MMQPQLLMMIKYCKVRNGDITGAELQVSNQTQVEVNHGPIRLLLVCLVRLNKTFNDLILRRVERGKNTTTVCQPSDAEKCHTPPRETTFSKRHTQPQNSALYLLLTTCEIFCSSVSVTLTSQNIDRHQKKTKKTN